MAREWQQTRQKEYVMPYPVYYQCIWAVRDFDRMVKRLEQLKEIRYKKSISIVKESKDSYDVHSPTEDLAIEIARLSERVNAITMALSIIPDAYKKYVLANIILKDDGKYYPDKMWRIWKQRFLYQVAKNLSLY